MIFGLPGSGKSTFAYKLSQKLSIPLHHVDKFFFVQNWQERDPREFQKMLQSIVAKPEWIIDGNAMRYLEMRWALADVIIYFKMPADLCLWRIIKRCWFVNPLLDDLPVDCPRKVSWQLVNYLFNFKKRYGDIIENHAAKYSGKHFFRIETDKEAAQLFSILNKDH